MLLMTILISSDMIWIGIRRYLDLLSYGFVYEFVEMVLVQIRVKYILYLLVAAVEIRFLIVDISYYRL